MWVRLPKKKELHKEKIPESSRESHLRTELCGISVSAFGRRGCFHTATAIELSSYDSDYMALKDSNLVICLFTEKKCNPD